MNAPASMRRRSYRAAGWSLAETWLGRCIDLATFVVLARLLSPGEVGLAAAAMAVLAIVDYLGDLGMSDAYVQRPSVTPGHLGAVAIGGVLAACIGAAVLVLLAGPLESLFGIAGLAPLIRLLALSMPIRAVGLVPAASLYRQLTLRPLAVRRVLASVGGGVVGIALAANGVGAETIAWKQLAQVAIATVAVWISSLPLDIALPTTRELRDLLGFGVHMVGTRILGTVQSRADDLLVGGVIGVAALGLYSVAYRILRTVTDTFLSAVNTISLPVFARVASSADRLARVYHEAVRTGVLLGGAAYLVMICASDQLIGVFFGAEYADAVPVARVLAIAGLAQLIRYFDDSLLAAAGHPAVAFRARVVVTVGQLAGFAVAASTHELLLVAVSYAAVGWAISVPLSVWCKARFVGIPAGEYTAIVTRLLVTGGIAVGAGALVFGWSSPPSIVTLAGKSALVAAVYVVANLHGVRVTVANLIPTRTRQRA